MGTHIWPQGTAREAERGALATKLVKLGHTAESCLELWHVDGKAQIQTLTSEKLITAMGNTQHSVMHPL